jgi:hypothetical protein
MRSSIALTRDMYRKLEKLRALTIVVPMETERVREFLGLPDASIEILKIYLEKVLMVYDKGIKAWRHNQNSSMKRMGLKMDRVYGRRIAKDEMRGSGK